MIVLGDLFVNLVVLFGCVVVGFVIGVSFGIVFVLIVGLM